nr:MAG TPA: hypothetical protein [Caudoviricetes sp.]
METVSSLFFKSSSLIHYHFNQMNCLAGAWRN